MVIVDFLPIICLCLIEIVVENARYRLLGDEGILFGLERWEMRLSGHLEYCNGFEWDTR